MGVPPESEGGAVANGTVRKARLIQRLGSIDRKQAFYCCVGSATVGEGQHGRRVIGAASRLSRVVNGGPYKGVARDGNAGFADTFVNSGLGLGCHVVDDGDVCVCEPPVSIGR